MKKNTEDAETFDQLFFENGIAKSIRVPDYQRAYSWEQKQVELFINDLVKYREKKGYYFGHFIVENIDNSSDWQGWEIVDGQQRITTFVLFLMICELFISSLKCPVKSLIDNFSTVSYDNNALAKMRKNLCLFFKKSSDIRTEKLPSDEFIMENFELSGDFTRSQRNMANALILFEKSFINGTLEKNYIPDYIYVVMEACCSLHLTSDKSVAVRIFEMHNTRGVALSTIEIVKAKLMQHVYDYGGDKREEKIKKIQEEFGKIYAMQESLARESFRGNLSIEQLLCLHLRVVDDGEKGTAQSFHHPAVNANANDIINYIDTLLKYEDFQKKNPINIDSGVNYAIKLAEELKNSVEILCMVLPSWDKANQIVGDVMILEREISCQFFLLICRTIKMQEESDTGDPMFKILKAWEKLLFTRNFHDKYYRLWYKDDFPRLFSEIRSNEQSVLNTLEKYLKNGFRNETIGLQKIVEKYLTDEKNKNQILNNAFNWWKEKIKYVIYKYEISEEEGLNKNSNLRKIMKSSSTLEHILPQSWESSWLNDDFKKSERIIEINACVNGLGNLLILSNSKNSSLGNQRPENKRYEGHDGPSYSWHEKNLSSWENPENWTKLINERGIKIYNFMLTYFEIAMPKDQINATNQDNYD